MKLKLFGVNFLFGEKDGGPKSKVWMYGIEFKRLFSILLLRFENGTREAYHSHAFNCVSLVLHGQLVEDRINCYSESLCRTARETGCGIPGPHFPMTVNIFRPRSGLFVTTRDNLHRVTSHGRTWVLTFRGPWSDTWKEIDENQDLITLTHGRVRVDNRSETQRRLERIVRDPNVEVKFARKHGTTARQ